MPRTPFTIDHAPEEVAEQFMFSHSAPSAAAFAGILPALFHGALAYNDDAPMSFANAILQKQQWDGGEDAAGNLTDKAAAKWLKMMTEVKGLKEETQKILALWQQNGFEIEGMGSVPGTEEKLFQKQEHKEKAKANALARAVLQEEAPCQEQDRPEQRSAFLAGTDDGDGAWRDVLQDVPDAKASEDFDLAQTKEFDRTHDADGELTAAYLIELERSRGETTVTPGVGLVLNGAVRGHRVLEARALITTMTAHMPRNALLDRRFPIVFVETRANKLAMGHADIKKFNALMSVLKQKVGQVGIGAMLAAEHEARLINEAKAQGGRGVEVPVKDPEGSTMGVHYMHQVSDARRKKAAESIIENCLQTMPVGSLQKAKYESRSLRLQDTSKNEPVAGFAAKKMLSMVGDKTMNLLEGQLRMLVAEADKALQDVSAVVNKYEESQGVQTFLKGFTMRVPTAQYDIIGTDKYWAATADEGQTDDMVATFVEGDSVGAGAAEPLDGLVGKKREGGDRGRQSKRGRGSARGRGNDRNARNGRGRGNGRGRDNGDAVRRNLHKATRGGFGNSNNSSSEFPKATIQKVLGTAQAFLVGTEQFNADVAVKIPFVAAKIKDPSYGGAVGKGAYKAIKEWRNTIARTDEDVSKEFGQCNVGSWMRAKKASAQ